MKRDLKKWLEDSKDLNDFLKITNVSQKDSDISFTIHDLIDSPNSYLKKSEEDLIQFIWMSAQKQFLKDILDDIDTDLEKMYNKHGKSGVAKGQLVAYEESLKRWLHSKYHYLKRKNGV